MKILNLQDRHIDPRWIDEAEEDNRRICEVAKGEKVDAICIAGDDQNKPGMADDSSFLERRLQMAIDLQAIAPVFFIYGTSSHDSKGCYAPFKAIGWKEVNIGKSHIIGDLLIMGLPEINAGFIHSKYPELSKQEAIEQQYELTNKIIDDYYVPLSVSHKGPVHFMFHQMVDGVKFRDDQKPRTSDFVFTEQMLERIKANYYQAGHIHLPQMFKTIPGGYGGTPHLTWNDVNFKPGFDVIDYHDTGIKRFDFDKPMRQKIVIDSKQGVNDLGKDIIPGCNVHIEVKCDKEFHDSFDKAGILEHLTDQFNLAPLSKITTTIQHEEHTRVDIEEYEKAATLEDLYRLYNPDVSDSILKKVKIAEEATISETKSTTKRTFQFLDLWLRGTHANVENDVEEIYVDFETYKTGANLLIAPNGKGKSLINGFETPFSCHLPMQDNIKDFFVLKDSSAVRRFHVIETNEIITQKIIVDPTLAAPTAKYFMDIDGTAIADPKGNKDVFDKKVTEIFGSIKMFMACAFRGQKENDKIPSLEKAKESDLRQIFTELSGIDRTPIKNFSHEEVKRLKNKTALDEREVEVLEADMEKAEDIEKDIDDKTVLKYDTELSNKRSGETLDGFKSDLSKLDKVVLENENINKQIKTIETERDNTFDSNTLLNTELLTITETLKNADSTRSDLKKLKKVQEDHTTAATAYFEAQGVFNKSVTEWTEDTEYIQAHLENIVSDSDPLKEKVTELNQIIINTNVSIKSGNEKIEILNKPCEHCKKLSTTADVEIKKIKDLIDLGKKSTKLSELTITETNNFIADLRIKWSTLNKTLTPQPKIPDSLVTLKKSMNSLKPDPVKITELETIITGLKSSESRKTELETLIAQKKNRIDEITKQVLELKDKIKQVDTPAYEALKIKISDTEQLITDNTGEIGRLTAEIEALQQRLKKNTERVKKIKTISEKIVTDKSDRSEWEIVEADFSPKGIPAMELSMIAPLINREANDLLAMYSNRYRVEIITQDLDSKNNIAEKFKILVHDNKSNEPKNLPVMSGGQAVWLTKSLQEAISKIASQRSGRTWLYSIMDEVDGALDTEDIVAFYEMLERALDGKRKLISVSHSTEAKSYVDNIVDIEQFFVRGEG